VVEGIVMPQHTANATEADIREWCIGYLHNALKQPDADFDVHAELVSLGLDSAESVFMIAAIEDWLGLELASDTAVEHPTIADLATFVARELEAQSSRALSRR
jgi:acyl carrier protein